MLADRIFSIRTVSAWAALILPLALALSGPAAAQDRSKSTLTVMGEGLAAARPDLAVVSQAGSAKDALAENSKATSAVIAAGKGAGIEARDLETTRVSVQPQYSYPAAGSREPRKIVGYEVSNALSIRVRDLDKLGVLLDRLVVVGANQLRDIELLVAEPGPLRDAARAAAMKDAVRKAGLYAEAAGVRIVRVMSIVEGQQNGPRPPVLRALAAGAPEARAAVPIEAGEQEFRGRVTAIFEIEPR
ncbi:MAG: SIMPL domain-containing protein [Xanthobacteraceae bacterium]|nr:SIMPL domain-containing protein [Xanthobacteraceae bacterium]